MKIFVANMESSFVSVYNDNFSHFFPPGIFAARKYFLSNQKDEIIRMFDKFFFIYYNLGI